MDRGVCGNFSRLKKVVLVALMVFSLTRSTAGASAVSFMVLTQKKYVVFKSIGTILSHTHKTGSWSLGGFVQNFWQAAPPIFYGGGGDEQLTANSRVSGRHWYLTDTLPHSWAWYLQQPSLLWADILCMPPSFWSMFFTLHALLLVTSNF